MLSKYPETSIAMVLRQSVSRMMSTALITILTTEGVAPLFCRSVKGSRKARQ